MNSILLSIILIPVIEIYLFIKIGSQIGALTTILLIFTTAIVGIYYAKYEGLNTLKSGFIQLSKKETPAYEIISGAAIAIAALLLIIPGFATDILGFLIIFPLTRKFIFKKFSKNLKTKKTEKNNFIDGDFEDIDDDNDKKYKILAKYIKDTSGETPDIETYIFVKDRISKYQLYIDINSKPLKNQMIQIETLLKFSDKEESKKKSYFEIKFATIIKIDDEIKEKRELEKIILCDVQIEIYPNLEKSLLDLLHNSGYPSIKFEKKINFEELYNQRLN